MATSNCTKCYPTRFTPFPTFWNVGYLQFGNLHLIAFWSYFLTEANNHTKYKAVENKAVSSCYKGAVPQRRTLLICHPNPVAGCGSTCWQSELPKGTQRHWWETSTIWMKSFQSRFMHLLAVNKPTRQEAKLGNWLKWDDEGEGKNWTSFFPGTKIW